MPRLALQPHVSFAIVDGRAVFLDLRRDRYFALDEPAASAFEEYRRGSGGLAGDALAAQLLATGMFRIGGRSTDRPPALPKAARALTGALPRPRVIDVVRIAWHLIRARRALRRRPLEQLLDARRGRDKGMRRGSPDPALALARRFQAARALIPIEPACLQDSLALHDWLAGGHAVAALVLGVKLGPFAAHCWVQLDDLVLNEAPDTVAAFTPILAIQ
jgi:hypothetical protein